MYVHNNGVKEVETDIDLTGASVEPMAMPDKYDAQIASFPTPHRPYCIKLCPPTTDSSNNAIIMEASSPVEQETWFNALQAEIESLNA